MRALGATPVPFTPGEIDGLDGMEAHLCLLVLYDAYEVYTLIADGQRDVLVQPGVIFVNNAAFDAFTADQQSMLRAAGDRMYSGSVESIVTNSPAVDRYALRRAG